METSRKIESALNISLPDLYSGLINHPRVEMINSHFTSYIETEADEIIQHNKGYILNPNSIEDLEDGTAWGSIKRYFAYGSKKKILKHRKAWFREWIEPKHFVIGGDGGEGVYFIKLNDNTCKVYRLDLETQKVRVKPHGLTKYIEYLERLAEKDA